jgi:hypothetical protein
MGLDAVVYRNIDTLAPRLRELVRITDPATGELEFISQGPPNPNYNDDLLSVSIRIGNSALVDWLREEIASRWNGGCETLLNAVLYSGSHSGDFIELDGVARIRREVGQIDLAEKSLPENLIEFFEVIRLLLDAAEAEKNPIAFV